ncbi:MAG: hypothetical protein Q4Q23_03040 [Methanobacteriaceae archaeon]|nr:hypothetical protein [Methanobacteriaceae archaeon]
MNLRDILYFVIALIIAIILTQVFIWMLPIVILIIVTVIAYYFLKNWFDEKRYQY